MSEQTTITSEDALAELRDRASDTLFGPPKALSHLFKDESWRSGWWDAHSFIRFGRAPKDEVKGEDWQAGYDARTAAEEPRRREIEAWHATLPPDSRAIVDRWLDRDGLVFLDYTAETDDDDLDEGAQRPFDLSLNLSDFFAYACADSESIPVSEIPRLAAMMAANPCGDDLWVCKRRQQAPIAPHVRRMKEAGAWDEEMDRLEAKRIAWEEERLRKYEASR